MASFPFLGRSKVGTTTGRSIKVMVGAGARCVSIRDRNASTSVLALPTWKLSLTLLSPLLWVLSALNAHMVALSEPSKSSNDRRSRWRRGRCHCTRNSTKHFIRAAATPHKPDALKMRCIVPSTKGMLEIVPALGDHIKRLDAHSCRRWDVPRHERMLLRHRCCCWDPHRNGRHKRNTSCRRSFGNGSRRHRSAEDVLTAVSHEVFLETRRD